VLLGRDGKPLPGPFGIALSWPPDAPFQAIFTRGAGAPPTGPDQVMIDRASARKAHYAVGDQIEVAIGGQARPFRVSGVTGYGSADSTGGGSMAIFSLPAAQRLFGLTGRYSQIDVKAAAGISAQQLRGRVAPVLPPGVQAVTAASAAASQAQQLNGQLGFLTYFFAGFAGVSLLVGGFVIWNTFSIMVGQPTREMALLRTLGAGRGQVFRSVLGEAALLGAGAAVVGVLLGVGLARGLAALLSGFGLSLPITGLVVPPAGVAAAFGTGLVITVVAAVPPAWLATRVAPVQALRDAVPAAAVFSGRRLAGGLTVTAGGAALLLAGLFTGASVAVTAAGAVACFLGITALGPLFTPQLAAGLEKVPGVQQVTEVRTTDATVAGTAHQNVDGVDPAAIGAFTSLGVGTGSLASLSAGRLLVSQAAAASRHWRTGDLVTIGFGSYGVSQLEIGGIFANTGPLSPYLISNATFTADTGIGTDSVDLVRAPPSARGSLLRALSGYPGAQLLDQAGYAGSRGALLGTILNLITALLLLAVIIALLGIVSTLALSVVERTRELGLLRAIGMRRTQLGQMIAAESVIIAVIGAVLGTALGLGLGTVLAASFTRSQQLTVTVPAGRIVIYVAAAALAGLLAAIAPARRAAAMNMLQAIAAE
jgi:putative ABC transport system permease protein